MTEVKFSNLKDWHIITAFAAFLAVMGGPSIWEIINSPTHISAIETKLRSIDQKIDNLSKAAAKDKSDILTGITRLNWQVDQLNKAMKQNEDEHHDLNNRVRKNEDALMRFQTRRENNTRPLTDFQ